jgi:2-hydroxychromene-2-carboxylate isomerase
MRPPIRYLFDFISPFAYLGWDRSRTLAEVHDRAFEPIPVLFAALLNHHGQLGPAEVEPKRRFMFRQVFRRARRWGVPFGPPPHHPFNPLLALRIASLDSKTLGAPREHVIDALFTATWGRAVDPIGVETPRQISRALEGLAIDVPRVLEAAIRPENKARLRAVTDASIANGVFGVPTLDVDGELFWGSDALQDVDDVLAGRDEMDELAYARWNAITPSASRV